LRLLRFVDGGGRGHLGGERKVFASNAELKVSFLAPVPVGTVLFCHAQVVGGGRGWPSSRPRSPRPTGIWSGAPRRPICSKIGHEQKARLGCLRHQAWQGGCRGPRMTRGWDQVHPGPEKRSNTNVAGEGKRKDSDARRLQETGVDTVQVVIDYVRQETVEPLKGVGRFLIFGVAARRCSRSAWSCCSWRCSAHSRPRPARSMATFRGFPTSSWRCSDHPDRTRRVAGVLGPGTAKRRESKAQGGS